MLQLLKVLNIAKALSLYNFSFYSKKVESSQKLFKAFPKMCYDVLITLGLETLKLSPESFTVIVHYIEFKL